MKIIRFTAENFKRLSLVEITPTGEIVEVSGKNGAGKSSVLDAIDVALRGMEVAPRKPIKTGAEEARIRIDLGELVVTRTFRKSEGGEVTTSLRVEAADGVKQRSPQALLDGMIGALAFDPLAFERMDRKEQFDALRRFVPDVDFDTLDRLHREDFERRTLLNRKAKEAKAAAEKIVIAQGVGKLIDESALVAKLEAVGRANTEIETRKAKRATVANAIDTMRRAAEGEIRTIAENMKAIDECRARVQTIEAERAKEQARLDAAPPLPEPVDTNMLLVDINIARLNNAGVAEIERGRVEREKLIAEAQKHAADADEITIAMDKREVGKRAKIAAAKLPVEGLAFGDGELLYGNEPFSQASDAERLRVSIAMAMAMNSKLRVIRVRDGSLMDDDSMRLLADMAKVHGYQVWIERVGNGGSGFVLEDGHLKLGSTA